MVPHARPVAAEAKDKANQKAAGVDPQLRNNLGNKSKTKAASSPMGMARTYVLCSIQESAHLRATPRSARKVTAPTFAANVARLGTLLRIAHPTVEATADTTGSPAVGANPTSERESTTERI